MRPPLAGAPAAGFSGANSRDLGVDSGALGRQLDIKVLEAQLVRIFDKISVTQDVFVQLVCGYEDGSEKVVGRTPSHKKGNLAPKWNHTFETRRGGGKTLKFKVFRDHLLKSPVLCGEAEFDLDTMWARSASAGAAMTVPVTLFKRGEQTGVLYIGLALRGLSDGRPQQMPQRPSQQAGPGGMPVAAAGGAAGTPASNGLRLCSYAAYWISRVPAATCGRRSRRSGRSRRSWHRRSRRHHAVTHRSRSKQSIPQGCRPSGGTPSSIVDDRRIKGPLRYVEPRRRGLSSDLQPWGV